jgi:hypothetical protein
MQCQLGAASPNEVWGAGQACDVLGHVLVYMITYDNLLYTIQMRPIPGLQQKNSVTNSVMGCRSGKNEMRR